MIIGGEVFSILPPTIRGETVAESTTSTEEVAADEPRIHPLVGVVSVLLVTTIAAALVWFIVVL